jgi:hypothetical protein
MRSCPGLEGFSMKEAHEKLFGVLFGLTFPLVMGFAVSVSIYVDGLGTKSLIMLGTWLAATCFLWAFPSFIQRFSGTRRVFRDERDILILKHSALVAHAATWLFFATVSIAVCWIVGANGVVSVNVLPLVFVGGVVVFQVALVLSDLVQERMSTLHDR